MLKPHSAGVVGMSCLVLLSGCGGGSSSAGAGAQAPSPADLAAMPDPGAAQGCPSDPGVAAAQPAGGNRELAIKHAIYSSYTSWVSGGQGAPLAIGVTFQALQVGDAMHNNANYPAAADDSDIIPVHSAHTLCKAFTGEQHHVVWDANYVCYISRVSHDWECGDAAGTRMVSSD
jgi:hypothetical protein